MDTAGQKYLDWACVIAANFMWATQVAAIKLIGDRLGPVTIAFVPMVLSTVLFVPGLWIGRRTPPRVPRAWSELRHFLAAGLFGAFLLQLTYVLGAQRTLAANAGIITLTIPVITAMTASFMLGERINAVRVVSFALALAGVCLTSLSDLRGASLGQSRYFAGNLLFLGACAFSAFYNTYCKLLVDRGYSEFEILVYTSLVASLAGIPLLLWFEPDALARITGAGAIVVLAILELALIVYGAAMLVFFYVLRRLDVTQAILGNYLLPFFIALLGLLFFGESVTLAMAAGGAVILVSTLAITIYEGEILKWRERRKLRFSASPSR